MASFSYKTRSKTSPQGKQRVYFCCHPEDFEVFFESITNEILEKQNCAIWYADESVERNEDFLADLEQMQLFVMPVTTKLLCNKNWALDVEFPFAEAHHIPVLPLMQESGLEALFNKKCGDLQFLDKQNTDITAISYDEKLRKYLATVLIGDELAEQIRAAFDAYVFLSYRKKDRKHAQELMRLIHKNEFCRDIAIWYDEFLVPGENFNNSIEEALRKSGLFVLAVTPNLVNETNYVMTVEYPMAKQAGKLILPAELVPTDKQSLLDKYEDIPVPTDAHNEEQLSKALLDAIREIAIRENDASPAHNFFIGLAYLDGIDVEVDLNRAKALIESAANAGLVSAQKKLVAMYETGHGVKRDIGEAFTWQHRLAEQCYEQYIQNPTEETATEACLAYMHLGELFEKSNLITSAEEAYQSMLTVAQSSAKSIDSKAAKILLAMALNNSARFKNSLGEYTEFNRMMRDVSELDKKIGDVDIRVRACHLTNLGLSYYFLQDYENACAAGEEALTILESSDQDDSDFLMLKAQTHNNLGLALESALRIEEAVTQYERAEELSEIVNERTDFAFAKDHGNILSNLAAIYIRLRNDQQAKNILKKTNIKLKKLFRERMQFNLASTIGCVQNLIARLYSEQRDREHAQKHYEEALSWYRFEAEIFAGLHQAEMALVLYNLGTLHLEADAFTEATDCLTQAHGMFVQLSQKEKNHRAMRALSGYNLAALLMRQNRYKDAQSYMQDSFDMYKAMFDEGLTQYAANCQNAARQMCQILLKTGHPIQAIRFMSDAMNTLLAET